MPLPRIGIEAVLLINIFRKNVNAYNRLVDQMSKKTKASAQVIAASSKDVVKSFDDLLQKVRDNGNLTEDVLKRLATSSRGLAAVWKGMGAPDLDVSKFEEGVKGGNSFAGALRGAAAESEQLTSRTGQLTSALSSAGMAIGIVIAAFSILNKVLQKAVQEHMALVTEVRNLQFVMGTTSLETSTWAKFARDAGVSVDRLGRGVSYLEQQLTDLRLRQIEGKEATTAFTRALKFYDIAWQDSAKNMLPADEVMENIITTMQGMEDSGAKANLVIRLFGRTGGRDLLPVLLETNRTLEETQDRMIRLGVAVTAAEEEGLTNMIVVSSDLKDSFTGLWNVLGKNLMPTLTLFKVLLTEAVVDIKNAFIVTSTWATYLAHLVGTFGNVEVAGRHAANAFLEMTGIGSEAARTTEEQAKADGQATIDAMLRADAIENLNKKLTELATTYQDKLADAQTQYQERLEDAERRHSERLEDIQRKRARDFIERSIRLGWQLQDMWEDHQEKLADITAKHTSRLAGIEVRRQEQLTEYRERAQKEREDLEAKHQERLYEINTKYFDTIEEAARKNDAVAVVRAMRERARAIRDAEHQKGIEKKGVEDRLAERRKEIQDDYEKRKAAENTRYQEEIATQNARYAKQLEDLRIQKERERQLRQLHQRWEEEDLKRSYARQLADLERSRDRQLAEIEEAYAKERAALTQQIQALTDIGVQGVQLATAQLSEAVSAGVAQIAQAAAIDVNQRAQVPRGTSRRPGSRTTSMAPREAGQIPQDEPWYRRLFANWRQSGGVDVVNKPTHYVAGEGGAEVAAFIPVRRMMNVRHSFGNLPMNIDGLPGGTNTSQAEAIVNQAMQMIAERLIAEVTR